ncbi:MAG: tRNA-dihydrouridine synthase family protein [Treponema sp.]|nr:tRNA-dihydrouridine synthase family protein [Treponema sp.]
MAELSHRPLRELIESFGGANGASGADEYFTEMISAGAFVARGPFEPWYADGGPCPGKVVYQLTGGDPGRLAEAAGLLDRLECLGIDINMGCSAPAITRTGAGIRWMESIDKAGKLIEMVRKPVKKRLSVKLRLGAGKPGTVDFDYLVRFCRRLEEAGVELITLHPRLGGEKFRRRARWEYVSALRKELRIPLAGNGDIASGAEMRRRAEDCDAVMIGRLAVRQPWVFAGAPGADIDTDINIEETGLKFLGFLAKYQPPEFHLSRARRFFGYFCDNLKWGNYVKTLLNREQNLAGTERAWQGYFVEHPEERLPAPHLD